MLVATSEELAGDRHVVARAEAVRSAVAAAADEIEERRRLPPALLDKLHEAELFRLLLPRPLHLGLQQALGGLALDLLRPRLDLLFPAGLMVFQVLLAHFLMFGPENFYVLGARGAVPLLGVKLPLCEGLIIPVRPCLQLVGAVVQPFQFGGLAFAALLRERLKPAAYAVMAVLDPVGYAVPFFLNRAQALCVAQARHFPVAGMAFERGLFPR